MTKKQKKYNNVRVEYVNGNLKWIREEQGITNDFFTVRHIWVHEQQKKGKLPAGDIKRVDLIDECNMYNKNYKPL